MHLEMPQALFCRALRGWKGLRISGLGFRVYLWFGVSGMERSSSGGLGVSGRERSCEVSFMFRARSSSAFRKLHCTTVDLLC